MAVSDDELRPVGPWPAGINNVAKEHRLPTNEAGAPIALREAVNVDLDSTGWPSLRRGFQRFYSGSLSHSVWSHKDMPFGLFVDADELCAVFPDGRVDPLGLGIGPLPVSFTLINDRVYLCNRTRSAMVTMALQVMDWAPSQPAGRPTAVRVQGYALSQGQYQVAVTFTDVMGRESGCAHAVALDVEDGGGIELSAIPQPADPVLTPWINVYASGPNDQVMRLAGTVPAGVQSWLITSLANGRSLTTQFLAPLPAGQIVRNVNGRQYVAVGDEVLYSEPLRYGLYNPVRNRIRFTAEVSLLEPCGKDGIYVAAGKRTYWMSGRDPAAFEQVIRRSTGAVKFSGTQVPGNVLGVQTEEDLPVWLADSGHLCVGTVGGAIVVLKDGEAVIPDADRAALLLRQEGGLQQVVAALRGQRPQGLAVRDSVVARVVYDGSAQ